MLALTGMMVAAISQASEIPVAEDTTATAGSDSNSGSLPYIAVSKREVGFLGFDLSTLPPGTTAANVHQAHIKLFFRSSAGSGTVSVVPVTGAWTEDGLTGKNTPTTGASISTIDPTDMRDFTTLTVDVTSLVKAWLTTPASNLGIALKTSDPNLRVQIDSKENVLTGHAASLDITLAANGPAGPVGPVGPPAPQARWGLPGPQV